MKKIVLLLTIAGALLAACGNGEAKKQDSEQEVEKAEVEAPESEAEANETEVEENGTEAEENETEAVDEETETAGQTINELPEYATIQEKVGSEYTVETETDNEGKRVLFLKDQNGKKQYKTIYVKHDSYLKIIKINGDGGLVFEGEV